jgi:hypothetical protein
MVLKCFSGVFATVLDVCFKCFICLLFVCCTVASRCFKNKSSVAHGMHVGSERRCGDFWGGVGDVRGCVGPLLVRSLTSPTRYTLVCSSAWQRPNASVVLDGRPGASKSVNFIFPIQSRTGMKPIHYSNECTTKSLPLVSHVASTAVRHSNGSHAQSSPDKNSNGSQKQCYPDNS